MSEFKSDGGEENTLPTENKTVKKRKTIPIAIPVACGLVVAASALIIAFMMIYRELLHPMLEYNKTVSLMITECQTDIKDISYENAVMLMNEGKYDEAIKAFSKWSDYKDSADLIEKCYIGKYGEEKYNRVKSINVGDIFRFGSYEQNNNASDGKEEIEWIVLEKDGMSLLLISKYALDSQPYNTSYAKVTWKTCSLRKWLNETFINNAFSAEEQKQIQDTTVTADKNPKYGTSPGNDATDKVFLLSITEVNKYFSSDDARKCLPSAYAIAQGAYTNDYYSVGGKATCWWWLRSPGNYSYSAALVNYGGSVGLGGLDVFYAGSAVRPAMWISLEP